MAYTYEKQLWKDYPDTTTPVTAERLNHMEDGIKGLSDAQVSIEVVDSLDGDSTTNAPSVRAVNEEFIKVKGKISWRNSNPKDGMGNDTTITLSNDDYDFIEVIFLTYPSRKTYSSNKVFNVDGAGEINALFNYNGILFGGSRYFTFVDKTHLKFETCYGMNIKDNNDYKARNDWLIPYMIITYKTGLLDNTSI